MPLKIQKIINSIIQQNTLHESCTSEEEKTNLKTVKNNFFTELAKNIQHISQSTNPDSFNLNLTPLNNEKSLIFQIIAIIQNEQSARNRDILLEALTTLLFFGFKCADKKITIANIEYTPIEIAAALGNKELFCVLATENNCFDNNTNIAENIKSLQENKEIKNTINQEYTVAEQNDNNKNPSTPQTLQNLHTQILEIKNKGITNPHAIQKMIIYGIKPEIMKNYIASEFYGASEISSYLEYIFVQKNTREHQEVHVYKDIPFVLQEEPQNNRTTIIFIGSLLINHTFFNHIPEILDYVIQNKLNHNTNIRLIYPCLLSSAANIEDNMSSLEITTQLTKRSNAGHWVTHEIIIDNTAKQITAEVHNSFGNGRLQPKQKQRITDELIKITGIPTVNIIEANNEPQRQSDGSSCGSICANDIACLADNKPLEHINNKAADLKIRQKNQMNEKGWSDIIENITTQHSLTKTAIKDIPEIKTQESTITNDNQTNQPNTNAIPNQLNTVTKKPNNNFVTTIKNVLVDFFKFLFHIITFGIFYNNKDEKSTKTTEQQTQKTSQLQEATSTQISTNAAKQKI